MTYFKQTLLIVVCLFCSPVVTFAQEGENILNYYLHLNKSVKDINYQHFRSQYFPPFDQMGDMLLELAESENEIKKAISKWDDNNNKDTRRFKFEIETTAFEGFKRFEKTNLKINSFKDIELLDFEVSYEDITPDSKLKLVHFIIKFKNDQQEYFLAGAEVMKFKGDYYYGTFVMDSLSSPDFWSTLKAEFKNDNLFEFMYSYYNNIIEYEDDNWDEVKNIEVAVDSVVVASAFPEDEITTTRYNSLIEGVEYDFYIQYSSGTIILVQYKTKQIPLSVAQTNYVNPELNEPLSITTDKYRIILMKALNGSLVGTVHDVDGNHVRTTITLNPILSQ